MFSLIFQLPSLENKYFIGICLCGIFLYICALLFFQLFLSSLWMNRHPIALHMVLQSIFRFQELWALMVWNRNVIKAKKGLTIVLLFYQKMSGNIVLKIWKVIFEKETLMSFSSFEKTHCWQKMQPSCSRQYQQTFWCETWMSDFITTNY